MKYNGIFFKKDSGANSTHSDATCTIHASRLWDVTWSGDNSTGRNLAGGLSVMDCNAKGYSNS